MLAVGHDAELKKQKKTNSQNVGTVCTAKRRELTRVASLVVGILKSLGTGFKQMLLDTCNLYGPMQGKQTDSAHGCGMERVKSLLGVG